MSIPFAPFHYKVALRDLYGEIGYTIIDDARSLPERMPGIYRRLTT
jgi:nitric oxide reductase activation protein